MNQALRTVGGGRDLTRGGGFVPLGGEQPEGSLDEGLLFAGTVPLSPGLHLECDGTRFGGRDTPTLRPEADWVQAIQDYGLQSANDGIASFGRGVKSLSGLNL